MTLWISHELSTARRSHPPAALTARTLGSMTQDLSAGTSSPQPVPGTRQPPAPTIKAPATRTPDIETPATETPARTTMTAAKPASRRAPGRKGKHRRKPSAPRRGERRAQPQTGRSAGVAPDAGTVAERRIRIGSPASLLAVVPVLLGFEPGNSMVVIGVGQPGAEVRLTLRYDLPDPGAGPRGGRTRHERAHRAAHPDRGRGGVRSRAPRLAGRRGAAGLRAGSRRYRDRTAPGGQPALLVLRVRRPGLLPAGGQAIRRQGPSGCPCHGRRERRRAG